MLTSMDLFQESFDGFIQPASALNVKPRGREVLSPMVHLLHETPLTW